MKKLLLFTSAIIAYSFAMAQCGKATIPASAIVKVNDNPWVQTGDALWICEDRNVDIQGDGNTVYVEKNSLITLTGNNNVAFVKEGGAVTITGDGNKVTVDSNVVAASNYDDQGTNTQQIVCDPASNPLKFDYKNHTSVTGCIDTSWTGVAQIVDDGGINLYPNPVSNVLNVTVSKQPAPTDYRVYSISGKVVLQGKMINNPHQIDMSTLEEGLYFIELQSSEGRISKRISVQ